MLRYHILLFKLNRLASRNTLSGVEEISLAGQLAEMIGSADTAARIIDDLADHANPQVRRIALNAIRRGRQFTSPSLQPALVRRMADAEAAVRHDAVWIVQESRMDGAELRAALRRLAGKVRLPWDAERARANPGDTALAAQVRARMALDNLLEKSAAERNQALAAMALGTVGNQPYAEGTVGHKGLLHRALIRRQAGRRLDSSVKLTFRKVEPAGVKGNKRFLL
ncbi:HEAT repeat domain-containing protein [Cupriavidus sp. IK-TO18]|uniref:HEAT repeat domain-containing protein n=1 Tax=Cupriavidus sp. IK-TO18 TaxID=2782182 RepID=UPI0018995324|nr:HEAT repeat domain-containing protein [Cupriavidus sp. IK-TO18]MBF6988887.1 HEAT repeat domain-containing protein [Cupriavidus sp. IK-TO18]